MEFYTEEHMTASVNFFFQCGVSIDGKLAEVMRRLPKFFIKQ